MLKRGMEKFRIAQYCFIQMPQSNINAPKNIAALSPPSV